VYALKDQYLMLLILHGKYKERFNFTTVTIQTKGNNALFILPRFNDHQFKG
jgi:hypothetical protein